MSSNSRADQTQTVTVVVEVHIKIRVVVVKVVAVGSGSHSRSVAITVLVVVVVVVRVKMSVSTGVVDGRWTVLFGAARPLENCARLSFLVSPMSGCSSCHLSQDGSSQLSVQFAMWM